MEKLGSNIPSPGAMTQYTLFPSKKKRGGGGHQQRSKRSPEKIHFYSSSGGSREPVTQHYRIMSRKSRDTYTWDRQGEYSNLDPYPAIKEASPRPVPPQSKQWSFADMVKAPPDEKKAFKQATTEVLPSGKKFVRKNVRNEKAVLNQISASTYNKIGRSDDRSKYVMSGREEEGEQAERARSIKRNMKTIPSAIRSDVEVEFRASDSENEADDFQVEFSSSAAIRRPKEAAVNKISALTFQQIGRTTSDHETYVMKPSRSWSAVVGKRTVTSSNQSNPHPHEQNTEGEDQSERSREPTVHDKIKMKLKEGIELTPEERELLREKRRERRKREKEKKNKEKEDKARQDMMRPQTTKLNFISGDVLNLVKNNSKPVSGAKNSGMSDKGIKFMDEEYPDLGAKVKPVILSTEIRDEAGRVCSDRESNSEWETEDDQELEAGGEEESGEEAAVEIVTEPSGPISYSSILKSVNKSAPTPGILKVKIKPEEKKVNAPEVTEKKKVKKNDPILFDFNSAIVVKQAKEKKKNATVVTGKLKKDAKIVRNQLDSSAPAKKRGKEREGGKKKRKSVMKKIIIAEREKRRSEAEKRREERIKQGVTLKPLEVKDDFDETVIDQNTKTNDETEEPKPLEKVEEATEELSPSKESQIVQESMERSVEQKAKDAVHSRKFRPYCSHLLSPEVNTTISSLMSDLIRFQDKQYAKDPDKAKAKRRYVVGLREVAKFLKVKKIKAIILAPDIEKVETEGGLDDAVMKLLADSASLEVPTFFGLNRYKLGKLCLKKVPISCIGILNYQGSDENFKSLVTLTESLKEAYKSRIEEEIEKITNPAPAPSYRPPSNSSSLLSTEAPEFVPSFSSSYWPQETAGHYNQYSDNYNNFYDYTEGVTYYSGQNYYQDSERNESFDPQGPSNEHLSQSEAQIWGNMLDILKG